jgi:hypothetical protein
MGFWSHVKSGDLVMSDEERSPRILAVAWGRMKVDGIIARRERLCMGYTGPA